MKRQLVPPRAHSRAGHSKKKGYIPREFAPLIDAYALDSEQRIELWCYAIALLMIDEERVRLIGTREISGRTWVTLQIPNGEEFDLVKPALTEATERQLLEGVREIVEKRVHKNPSRERFN
jgi:hypothetical protein